MMARYNNAQQFALLSLIDQNRESIDGKMSRAELADKIWEALGPRGTNMLPEKPTHNQIGNAAQNLDVRFRRSPGTGSARTPRWDDMLKEVKSNRDLIHRLAIELLDSESLSRFRKGIL